MLGDHSVSLWPFKRPTERLYKQGGNCPANISVVNAHCVLHTVWAARDVPLLGMWGQDACWPPRATWEAGTGTSRGAGSTRTACTTGWHSCWTMPEWAVWPQRNTVHLCIFWCAMDSMMYCMPYKQTIWQRYGRQPVAAHHHHVITAPQQPFLSKICRGLCRKTPLSHDRNTAGLCMDIQAVGKHQLGEKFRFFFQRSWKLSKRR